MSNRIENLSSSTRLKNIEQKAHLRNVFDKFSRGADLTYNESKKAAELIFDGLTYNRDDILVLLTAYFSGLTMKMPTVKELSGMASAMNETKTYKFHFNVKKPLVTAGGTGGDSISTINVTTPAVIVASSSGSFALKSGAKAFSSKTGASDLAETLGININASPSLVEECVQSIGCTFWDSGGIYPWMTPLISLGSREIMSTIIPYFLSLRLMIATGLNPFSLKRQVRGLSIPLTKKVAQVFAECGYEKALVVLGYGPTNNIIIDEISSLGKTIISELKTNGQVDTYSLHPEDLGIRRGKAREIIASDSHLDNAKTIARVLLGLDKSPRRDLILVNAASILYIADEVANFKDGYELARQSLDEGKAIEKLKNLVELSGGQEKKLDNILNSLH